MTLKQITKEKFVELKAEALAELNENIKELEPKHEFLIHLMMIHDMRKRIAGVSYDQYKEMVENL